MIISNIRKRIEQDKAYLVADIRCNFSKNTELWFGIDKKYEDWLTVDVYDAFLVEAIYMAMYYGEDIEITGLVSKKIYKNLIEYIMPVIHSLRPQFKIVSIDICGFGDADKSTAKIIGTGFSGGVDSFSTIIDKYEIEKDLEYKLNTLFFFNVGQYPGKNAEIRLKKALQHYNNSKALCEEINLPFVFLDSNMFEFYLPQWEYDAGPLCRISSILALQRGITRYYISGSNHYLQQNSSVDKQLDDVTDEFIYTMLSPVGMEIILDGNQYYRSDKIRRISQYDYVKRHLNVCVNSNIDVQKEKNCSVCHKCLRTLIVLESYGLLDQYKAVFNLDKYKEVSYRNKCYLSLQDGHGAFATENARIARENGIKMPSKLNAWLYLLPYRIKKKLLGK